MSKTGKIVVWVVVLVLVVWGISALNDKEEVTSEEIVIGFMGPLTGDAASYGLGIQRGVQLALKDSGLTNVRVVYEDSMCDPTVAVNAINKLISSDGVVAVIGEVCSGATLATAPVAGQNGVVLISASSTSPALTDAGEHFFRVVPSDALQGVFAADLIENDGATKLAILYGNEEYGIGLEGALRESFEAGNGAVVASESFEAASTDIRTQLTKIKAENPEAIYLVSNSIASAVSALKQIKELGIDAVVYGSEGMKTPDIPEGAGDAAEGLIISSVSSGTTEFTASHNQEYGEDPGPFAAQGYDAFTALAEAIKGGASSAEEIQAALPAVEFSGASGSIKFDSNGDVFGNYDVFVVENGEFIAR